MPETAAHRYNFSAGPAVIPAEVLALAKSELTDWQGSGFSILETPFTGDAFKHLMRQAREDLRSLLKVPENYRILFLQGGASAQFSLVPLNLLGASRQADYVETGYWSVKNIREAQRYCDVRIVASSASTAFDRMPEAWQSTPGAAYCHITSNETANGVQFQHLPHDSDTPLVADMTSDFLSRPFDVSRYGLIYAAAQKNVGPSGITILLVREDLLGCAHPATPSVFNYTTQAEADSMLQTPVTFSVYLSALVFRWILAQGGLEAMEHNSFRRSAHVYNAIDQSDGFYRCPVKTEHRSRMNVCFQLADDALTPQFLAGATRAGLLNLKGHPMAGGIRASLYNAMPDSAVTALVNYMQEFAGKNRAV